MTEHVPGFAEAVRALVRAQRKLERAEAAYQAALRNRDDALEAAHFKGGTVRELGARLGISPAAVSKAVRRSR